MIFGCDRVSLVLFLAAACENPSLFPVLHLWRIYLHHDLVVGLDPANAPNPQYCMRLYLSPDSSKM